MLHYYGKITNIIADSEKLVSPTVADMAAVFTQLNGVKQELEEWKKALPSYYEPITVPAPQPQTPEEIKQYENYPYDTKLDYVTGTRLTKLLISGFCGHTMNLYRGAILRIDRHLLGRMFPTAKPSEAEIKYSRQS